MWTKILIEVIDIKTSIKQSKYIYERGYSFHEPVTVIKCILLALSTPFLSKVNIKANICFPYT